MSAQVNVSRVEILGGKHSLIIKITAEQRILKTVILNTKRFSFY